MVMGYVYPRQRDPKLWESPDDFYPEQMLNRRLPPTDFAPFGAGFRRCVGAAFATYELKVLLAQMVRRLELEAPKDYEPEEGMLGPMIGLLGPVPIDVVEIRPDPGPSTVEQSPLSPTG